MTPWKRFTWWVAQHDTEICYLIMAAFCLYMAWAVADAARAGRLGVGW